MAHRDGKLNSYRHSPSFHFTSWGQHCSIYVHVLYFSQQVYQWDKSNYGYGEVQANKQGVLHIDLEITCLKSGHV